MSTATGTRVNMTPAGSYVSVAGSLRGAGKGVEHVLKLGYTTRSPDERADPDDLETRFSSDHVLLDFASLLAGELDVDVIIRDCDFVKDIALRNPDQLKELVAAFTGSPRGYEKADAIAEEIGLTEDAAVKAGGGVAWVAVVLIVVLVARACNDAGKGNPQRKPEQ